MKFGLSSILSLIVFLASFQNSLILVDYNINRDYYEALCINKDKPEMLCHGTCQIKKEAQKDPPQNEVVKLSLEFNILPIENVKIPDSKINISENNSLLFYSSLESYPKGFFEILPHPPQNLV